MLSVCVCIWQKENKNISRNLAKNQQKKNFKYILHPILQLDNIFMYMNVLRYYYAVYYLVEPSQKQRNITYNLVLSFPFLSGSTPNPFIVSAPKRLSLIMCIYKNAYFKRNIYLMHIVDLTGQKTYRLEFVYRKRCLFSRSHRKFNF